MADPKENEEINEELSTDELKGVSGGMYALGKMGLKEKSLKRKGSHITIADAAGHTQFKDGCEESVD
mgnify:CR=1 FL=1